MRNYLFKKIIIFFSCLFFIVTTTFFLMKAIPGDPFISDQNIPKEALEKLYETYGLNKPIFTQYLEFLKGLVTFNLGPSYIYEGKDSIKIILEGITPTFILGIEALLLSITFGIFFGILSAFKRNNWLDFLFMLITLIGFSIPNFLLATILQYFFALKFKLLPVARWEDFSHSILPAIALASMPTAFITRLIRNNLIEVLNQDYIKTA